MIASAPLALGRGKARVDLLSVDRGNANSVVVRWRVVNEGKEPITEGSESFSPQFVTPESDVRGVTLVDLVSNRRYYPRVTPEQSCLCTKTASFDIAAGRSSEMFAVFPAPPPEVKTIAVAMPLAPAFTGVRIGDGPVAAPGVDPGRLRLASPQVDPLISTVDGEEQSVDDGDEQRVELSSDVLFALNKADVTPKARAILTGVAKQIDASPSTTVTVDGHTDGSGTDAINKPLSKRRAEAVERELRGLVTRQGVGYRTAGYGSAKPIADNSTAEGRRKNRRVTVTFARPKPTAPTTPAPPPPAASSGKPIASARPVDPKLRPVKVDIDGLTRDPSGLTRLTWTLTSTGTEPFASVSVFSQTGGTAAKIDYFKDRNYQGGLTAGVTLYEETGGLRYWTLRDRNNYCLCFDDMASGKVNFEQGEQATYYNLFKVPPEVRRINVEIPGYAPVRKLSLG
ncbi:OmpA family protein [Actinoallomurus sp. NBC_01490]|uniref:OmpA family protein n=1 Tax=Actinoallomurus sp. NBC_01490 TaxID=2903557 RepID=UPI002E365E2F|nr:OmpA family protein [Actinoallomurus sp. NBC_01490]